MANKRIHIIALDVPFPANYGGAIDMYYRIEALHKASVEVILHCYEYGRGTPPQLEEVTTKVYYYPRKKRVFDWFSTLPFIVSTRRNQQLLSRLLEDSAPILFEGLHTTFFLNHPQLSNRLKLVRTHNVEHDYYQSLAQQTSGWKKYFFSFESKRLKRFEPILNHADYILGIKSSDCTYFSQYDAKVVEIAPFFNDISASKDGQTTVDGSILFHGNLSVPENQEGVRWLLNNAFLDEQTPIIIAGKDCPDDLYQELQKNSSIQLVNSPSDEKMNQLIQSASVHVLFSFQATGVKLKLINALHSSGHVVVNDKMVEGTSLGEVCTVLPTTEDWNAEINRLIKHPLNQVQLEHRSNWLVSHMNPQTNCQKIIDLL